MREIVGVPDVLLRNFSSRRAAPGGDVVLVAEAGMAGDLRLDRLVGYARTAGAQVRLLGDPSQPAAVEARGVPCGLVVWGWRLLDSVGGWVPADDEQSRRLAAGGAWRLGDDRPRRPDPWGRLLEAKLGQKVEVENLAQDGLTSDQLLAGLRAVPTRTALQEAGVVVLGIGGADLNRGDTNLEAGSCQAEACYEPVLKEFARNFEAIVASIGELRGGEKMVLRAITQPNGFPGAEDVIPPFLKPVADKIGIYQARTANRAICQTMIKYGGCCIDVLRAFNGPSGMENAYTKGFMNHEDCCYPSAKGQRLMADLLFKTGLAPLR